MSKYLFLIALLFCFAPVLKGQASTPPPEPPEVPALYITGTSDTDPKNVEIAYDITHSGFVELHLMDSKKNKIWIKGYVIPKAGAHVFKIPIEPMKVGEKYDFILKFKGKDYLGSFNSPKK